MWKKRDVFFTRGAQCREKISFPNFSISTVSSFVSCLSSYCLGKRRHEHEVETLLQDREETHLNMYLF